MQLHNISGGGGLPKCLLVILAMSIATFVAGQDELVSTEVPGNEIFKVAEEMPRFPGCEALLYPPERKQCADRLMLQFIYQNIKYPEEARANGNEGTAVINFVVEKDGTISDAKIVKDVEGGCGNEALRVVNLMNEKEIAWIPGKQNGNPVRVAFNLPIRFKLEEIPDYELIDGDTVYTTLDEPLQFVGGAEALEQYINDHLEYPPVGNDSCSTGVIEVDALVLPDGLVKAINLTDYNDLGIDFQFAAIELLTESMGKWEAAKLRGRPVPTTYPIRLRFRPTSGACRQQVAEFDKAEEIVAEALQLYEAQKVTEALAKFDEALALFPENGEYLYSRGMIHMNEKNMEAACEDLTKAKAILGSLAVITNLLPIICQ